MPQQTLPTPCVVVFFQGKSPLAKETIQIPNNYGLRLANGRFICYKNNGRAISADDGSPSTDSNGGWQADASDVVRVTTPKGRLLWDNRNV